MRSRVSSGVVIAMLALTLVGVTAPTASAAPFSAKVSRSAPLVGEVVKVSGVVAPAKRKVTLQKYTRGRWVNVKSARTALRGRWAFTVRATAVRTSYRVKAPAVVISGRKYALRLSRVVRVLGVRPVLTLGAPVVQRTGSVVAPARAQFRPARPGTSVTLYRQSGATWVKTASAKQDSRGTATFSVAAHAPSTFRAVATPGSGAPSVTSGWSQSQSVSSTFVDNFNGPLSSLNWRTRQQEPGGLRSCARTDPGMVSYGTGYVTLKAARQATNPKGTRACPHGFWHNGMIGTAGAGRTFGPYGYFEARVQFQTTLGSHGAFWLQAAGPTAGGLEIDVAEYFGDGRSDGGLSSFVHEGKQTSGGIQPGAKAALGGARPSSTWHTYSVQWTPTGYVFRVDGIPTFSTNKPRVAHGTEELVLSLLTSDFELRYMKATSTTMKVDSVHAWQ